MKKLGRILTAMVTPFKDNGEVDYTQARKLWPSGQWLLCEMMI